MDIPILSALWQKLTGNDLTFLDVICFVMAFPVTLMYRAKAGSYPSQAVSAADSTPQVTRNLLGLFSSIAQFVLGIVTAFMDFLAAAGASIPFPAVSVGWKIAAILALGTLAANNVFKADLTPNTYPLLSAAFSLSLAYLSRAECGVGAAARRRILLRPGDQRTPDLCLCRDVCTYEQPDRRRSS